MTRPNKAFGQVAKQQDFAVEIDDTDSPYTTSGETHIYVDTSSAAVTVELATADLAVGKPVNIYDDGNNAATNNITITTEGSANFDPGGVSSLTIDTDGAYRQVRGGSTNWFADLNAQRSAVATEKARINDLSALLEKTTTQSFNANTDTTVDWDNQTVDTELYTYDTANDTIDVLEPGDYTVSTQITLSSVSDQDICAVKVYVNGSFIRRTEINASGAAGRIPGTVPLKDLSANDTIRIDIRSQTSGDIGSNADRNWAQVKREG